MAGRGLMPRSRISAEIYHLSEVGWQKAKWAITRGPAFGDEGIGFGRLNIACTREHLTDALDRLDRALEEIRGPAGVSGSFNQ